MSDTELTMTKEKQCCVRIPKELHKKAKSYAYSQGKTLQQFIIEVLEMETCPTYQKIHKGMEEGIEKNPACKHSMAAMIKQMRETIDMPEDQFDRLYSYLSDFVKEIGEDEK